MCADEGIQIVLQGSITPVKQCMPEDMKIDVERVSMDDHEQTIQSKRFFPLAVGAFLLRNVV